VSERKYNNNLYPKTGYTFKCADGVVITGSNWSGVAARLGAYRKRNGIPMGNPAQEVLDQACKNNPGHCTETNEVTERQLRIVSLKGRILRWFSDLKERRKRRPTQFVDTHTSLHRAGVCIICPFKRELQEGCSSCRAALRELRGDMIEGRSPHDGLVMTGCEILGTDLATAVHLDELTIDDPRLPNTCWRKKTI